MINIDNLLKAKGTRVEVLKNNGKFFLQKMTDSDGNTIYWVNEYVSDGFWKRALWTTLEEALADYDKKVGNL